MLFDMIMSSIPFGDQYEYTAAYNDFGHNPGNVNFWQQMDFLTPNLLKVLKPGRIAAIHIKDRIRYGHQTSHGFMAIERVSDHCGDHFEKHGFIPFGRITIVTDVVRENNGTYRLAWTENSNDSSKMGVGLPEYVLLFRKPPTDNQNQRADEPVTKLKPNHFACFYCGYSLNVLDKLETIGYGEYKCPNCNDWRKFEAVEDYERGYSKAAWQIDAHSFWRSNGNRPLTDEERALLYDHEAHVKRNEDKEKVGNLPGDHFLDPPISQHQAVLTDVNFMNGLNGKQRQRRLQNHTCPLGFDIVNRLIRRFTNEGEIILEPFAGLYTVPYCAMKLGRRAYGIELADEYFRDGLKYCKEADFMAQQPTLFDWLALQQADAEKIAA